MRLSVVVPTSSRAVAVAQTLSGLFRQSLPAGDYEILIVENGPKSGARRATRRAERRHPRHSIRYLHEATPGLLAGRHRGALEARGEILVFADDDIDAAPEWLAAIAETFADPAVHLVGGRNLPRYESPPPAWIESYWYTPPYGGRACIYLSLLDLGDEPLTIDANYVWGLNFAIRRATLFELGGFHPDNIPDELQHFQGDGETGLTMKANERGLKATYQPRALVHHRVPAARLTVGYFQRRAFYQGVCDSFTAIRRDPASLGVSAAPVFAGPLPVLPPPPGSSRASRRRRWTGALAQLKERLRPSPLPPEPAFSEVDPEIQAAYRAGFDFHQNAVRSRPGLLDWVQRNDYWDFRLPDLASRPKVGGGIRGAAAERP